LHFRPVDPIVKKVRMDRAILDDLRDFFSRSFLRLWSCLQFSSCPRLLLTAARLLFSAPRLTERGVLAFSFLDVSGYLRQVPFGAHFGFDNLA
jgi:hypothetical protein